jgi:DNA-binding response OmpR family regulator/ligand-binding sensor domain-containing protein
MKSRNYIKLIVICLAISILAIADTGKFYTSDKMSSGTISCITQDYYGFIWVGTEYGLNKFDGYHFTTYFTDSKDTTSIVNNEITNFFVDRHHRLWIGCSKGLMQYDYEHNCFKRYHFPNPQEPRVENIIEDADGNLLVGTAGYGLFSIHAGEDHLTKEEKEFRKHNIDEYCRRIFEDEQHNLWRGNHVSIVTRYKTNGLHPTSVKYFNLPRGPVLSYFKSDHQGIYIVCMYGIMRYDYSTGQIHDAGFDFNSLDSKVFITKGIIDHAGNIYIGTSGKGLLMIPRGSKTVRTVENSNGNFDLTSSDITDIYEDKNYNLWVGCYKRGLFQLNSGREAFSSWRFSAQDYILGSSVTSIAAGDEGDIWCTVQKNVVCHFDRNGKIIGRATSPDGANTIYRDRRGDYWLCSENVLYSYNPFTGASQPKMKCEGWGLNCMTDNGEGTLYISNYGKGLCIYDTSTGTSKAVTMNHPDKVKGYLCNDWIKALYLDSHGLLWIGNADGLSCMNPVDGDFLLFGHNNMLPGIQCLSIGEMRSGNMLFGTSAGLYFFDRKQNKMILFPHSEQLRSNAIYGIAIDHSQDIWLSTANGIWQYDSHKRYFIPHINGNGLTAKEYVLGAVLHSSDDRIAFGINDGITVFYPHNVKNMRLQMGNVYLTSFNVNGKSLSCLNDEFSIPYDDNSFTMEFSLLNFKNPDNITFQYRINGSSKWMSLPEGTNVLSFNRLKPGKYVIDVRAANNGSYSTGMKTVTVVVNDPWYASTFAYLIYCLLIIAVITFGIILFERHRKEELDEAKMRFLINATHDIRSPLTLIMGPLNKLKKRLVDVDSLADLDVIDRNAQRLLLLVNQILDERKIDKNQMQLHCRKTDMVQFISGICSLYQFNASQRNIKFRFTHADKVLTAWIDRINFEKVITNLLSNAFKYTYDGGAIEVRLLHDERNVILQVIDTGIGFDDEKTERLFQRFYQGRNAHGFHIVGTGIGLNLCRAIVTMHGGKITASNRSDGQKGACMMVSIPQGNAHLKPEEIEKEEDTGDDTAANKKKQASKNFKILLVDDDFEVAQYIKNELGDWFRFDICGNGREALDTLLANRYDLVISDIMMPEMDGIELLKNIKSNTLISDIPVILLTSKAEVSDRLEGFRKGADGFIAKPFNMEELHILIDNLVDNVRRLRGKFSGAQGQQEKRENVEVKGNDDALMDRVMKSVNENISDPDYNVERLTDDVGISRAQLHRKMKEITGISTAEFIRNIRLEQAARLIQEGKVNVTQVAYAVGFNNQTHFSTVFKKHFGVSPSEYSLSPILPPSLTNSQNISPTSHEKEGSPDTEG